MLTYLLSCTVSEL